MDYFEFKKYFKDKYKVKKDIWSMDDVDVVDYSGLEYDSRTLFYAIPGRDIDSYYDILNPKEFSEKIFNAFRKRYGDDQLKSIFNCTFPDVLKGKYSDVAKLALMTNNGTHGFDLYYTTNTAFNYSNYLYNIYNLNNHFKCSIDISEEALADLLGIIVSDVFTYIEDDNIIVIDSNRTVSYLTDVKTIANYVKKPIKEVRKILYAPKIEREKNMRKHQKFADKTSEILADMGLHITRVYGYDGGYVINFIFADGDEGEFRKGRVANDQYTVNKTIDGHDKYLNDLCHFVKDGFHFDKKEEALEMLEKYIIKNR